jgi:hypothetical protein
MGAPRTSPKVLEALQQFPNRDVNSDQLSRSSGLTREQVRSAMRTLVADDPRITVVLRGNTWRYTPETAKSETPQADTSFSRIGVLASGDILVRGDQTEQIFVLSELELN